MRKERYIYKTLIIIINIKLKYNNKIYNRKWLI